MRTLLLAGLLLATVLAGCTSDPGKNVDLDLEPAFERLVPPMDPMPEGAGHDHSDPAQHEFLWHYETSAYDPMASNAANVAGLHALDLQAGHLFGAVYGSHAVSVDGGLWIWDLSDPAKPQAVGSLRIPGSVGGDRSVGATNEGDFAVLGLESLTCFGHVNPLGSGIQLMLVDTSDKSRPVPSDSVFLTGQSLGDPDRLVQPSSPTSLLLGGYHSVEVADINGTDYVFAFGDVYRIDRTEQGGRLVYVSHFSVGHDMYIRETPDGRFWALAANGFGDFAIHDVTDPTDPVELGRWDIPDRDGLDGGRYLHTADVAFLDGRALVVVTSEDWEDHASPFWVLDATDPSNITMLGSWHNPWNHTALGIHFSLHNPRFHDDGILTMAQYHGGMVQFDFRHASTWSDPYLAAYAVTAKGSTASPRDPVEHAVEAEVCQLTTIEPGVGNDTPLYMDVEYAPDGSGIVYAADLTGGLYTFKPTTDHPVYGNATRSAGHVH